MDSTTQSPAGGVMQRKRLGRMGGVWGQVFPVSKLFGTAPIQITWKTESPDANSQLSVHSRATMRGNDSLVLVG